MLTPRWSGRQSVRRLDGDAALLGPGGRTEQANLPNVWFLPKKGGNGRADDENEFLAEALGLGHGRRRRRARLCSRCRFQRRHTFAQASQLLVDRLEPLRDLGPICSLGFHLTSPVFRVRAQGSGVRWIISR